MIPQKRTAPIYTSLLNTTIISFRPLTWYFVLDHTQLLLSPDPVNIEVTGLLLNYYNKEIKLGGTSRRVRNYDLIHATGLLL